MLEKLVYCLGSGFKNGWMVMWHIYGCMDDMTYNSGANMLAGNLNCSSWKLVKNMSTCIVEN